MTISEHGRMYARRRDKTTPKEKRIDSYGENIHPKVTVYHIVGTGPIGKCQLGRIINITEIEGALVER